MARSPRLVMGSAPDVPDAVGGGPRWRPTAVLSLLLEVRPPTGEPDAGDPPVRFGGRGGRNQSALSTPIGVR